MAIVVFIVSIPIWYIILRRYEEKLQLNDGLPVIVFLMSIASAGIFAFLYPVQSSGKWTASDYNVERESIEDTEQWENSRRR